MIRVVLLAFSLLLLGACTKPDLSRPLFNGENLEGWDTWLGPKYDTLQKKFDSIGGPGLNNDPERVFRVDTTDKEKAIHIMGTHFGGLSTKEEFSNYHLTLEFKWGPLKSPPKKNDKRDGGLLYHAVGPHGADSKFWMRSQEFQIQEGDIGDYWGCAGGMADIPVVKKSEGNYVFDPDGELMTFSENSHAGRHAIKAVDSEMPYGKWNTLELYCFGDTAVHVVNGRVTMWLYKLRQPEGDKEVPLKKGKIQLQSEGAEMYVRRIKIEPIDRLPEKIEQ